MDRSTLTVEPSAIFEAFHITDEFISSLSTSIVSTEQHTTEVFIGALQPEVDPSTSPIESDCSQFTFVVYVVVFGLMCTFGLVGNFLSLAVLGWERRDRGRVATFLLQTMAVVDNLFLLAAGVAQISMALKVYVMPESSVNVDIISFVSNYSMVVPDNTSTVSTAGCDDTGMSEITQSAVQSQFQDTIDCYDVTRGSITPEMADDSSLADGGNEGSAFALLIVNITAYMAVIVFPLVHVTQMWTVWITVLVSFNRYVAICRPFQVSQVSQVCTMKQTARQIVAIGVAIFVYCLPRFFEYQIEYEQEPYFGGRVVPRETITDLKDNVVYNVVYENLLYCLFVFLGPLVIIAVLNSCLVLELIRARRRRSSQQLPLHTGRGSCTSRSTVNGNTGASTNISGSTSGEQNLTLVMVVIVLIFVVCQTPAFVNQILYSLIGEEDYACGKVYYYYFHVSNVVVSANSSVNFVVYCVFRRQFRHRLRDCCRGQKTNRHLPYYQSTVYSQRQELPGMMTSSVGTATNRIDNVMHFTLRVVVPTVNFGSAAEQVSTSPTLSE